MSCNCERNDTDHVDISAFLNWFISASFFPVFFRKRKYCGQVKNTDPFSEYTTKNGAAKKKCKQKKNCKMKKKKKRISIHVAAFAVENNL